MGICEKVTGVTWIIYDEITAGDLTCFNLQPECYIMYTEVLIPWEIVRQKLTPLNIVCEFGSRVVNMSSSLCCTHCTHGTLYDLHKPFNNVYTSLPDSC